MWNTTMESNYEYTSLYDFYNEHYDSSTTPCTKGGVKKFRSHFLPTLYSLVFLLGLAGNSLVILVLFKYKRLKSMTDVYLLNLAISDLLFVFSLPFWSYYAADQWVFGDGLCKIISWIYLVGFYSGIFFIMLMSIDRYVAIVHAVLALTARTVTYGSITSLIVWVVAILASVPELIFSQSSQENNYTICKSEYPANSINWRFLSSLLVNILGLLIPSGVMTFCYSMIIKTLLYCRSEKKNKAVKMIFAVMIVFFVFWTPYNIVIFLRSLEDLGVLTDCQTSKNLDYAMQVTETLAFFHCCLNPIIYFFMGEKFKKYVKLLFKNWPVPGMLFKRCGLLNTYYTESSSSFHTQSTGDQNAL
ncbi:C-C chemokine receptor type 4 isoform X2 [Pelodiscus sinensis]|uniref:C-C motif chemokine receptor 4 n=2 Tax=Pelodiscus sinensis TaxID=13735 RepID=K7EZN7_PELSI|nr:C-C chemokine receptor type 4 isoform X2 [Pelodiscus sinensis]|eukprot:XP_006121817.3 C-C chemokine receptor type 4 isoform X2 [Pelodiscus sinensis]